MAAGLTDVINGIGYIRGFLLVSAGGSARRAVHLLRLDDGHNPLPWAIVLIACIAVLALFSL